MIRPDKTLIRVHVCLKPVDFRRQVNGLSMIVQYDLKQNPMSSELFVFFNRKRNKVRVLYWERSGYVLYGKYLEEDKFMVPKSSAQVMTITGEQLNWILDGIDINKMKPHPERHYDLTH